MKFCEWGRFVKLGTFGVSGRFFCRQPYPQPHSAGVTDVFEYRVVFGISACSCCITWCRAIFTVFSFMAVLLESDCKLAEELQGL